MIILSHTCKRGCDADRPICVAGKDRHYSRKEINHHVNNEDNDTSEPHHTETDDDLRMYVGLH